MSCVRICIPLNPGSYSLCPPDEEAHLDAQIRWKRLVVDEGHVSTSSNNLAVLTQQLDVERKWIVSGTPTRNLMGLSLGQPHESDLVEDYIDEEPSQSGDGPHIGELLYPADAPDSSDLEEDSLMCIDDLPDPSSPPARRWTSVDRGDLNKLGHMVEKFIGVPQFAHEHRLFGTRVTAPLMDPGGPAFGAIQVVRQVMEQVMFRHQYVSKLYASGNLMHLVGSALLRRSFLISFLH